MAEPGSPAPPPHPPPVITTQRLRMPGPAGFGGLGLALANRLRRRPGGDAVRSGCPPPRASGRHGAARRRQDPVSLGRRCRRPSGSSRFRSRPQQVPRAGGPAVPVPLPPLPARPESRPPYIFGAPSKASSPGTAERATQESLSSAPRLAGALDHRQETCMPAQSPWSRKLPSLALVFTSLSSRTWFTSST